MGARGAGNGSIVRQRLAQIVGTSVVTATEHAARVAGLDCKRWLTEPSMKRIWQSFERDIQKSGAAGIALLLLLLGVMTNRYRVELLPLRPQPEHFAILAALLVLAFLYLKKRARFQLQWSDALLAVYLTIALISSLWFPENPRASALFWARMISSVAIYFLARWLIGSTNSSAAVNLAIKTLLVWGVLEAGFGITAWLLYPFGINLGVDEYPLGVRGPGGIVCNFSLTMYGTLWEPNAFGGVLMAIVVIAAALFVSNDFVIWRKMLGAAMGIMLIALGLNASRGALATLGIGLLLVLIFVPGMALAQKLKWFLAAILLVAIIIIPSLEVSRALMQLPTAPGLAQRAPCAEWIAQGMPRGTQPGDPEFDPATGPESGSTAVRRFLEGQTLTSRWVSYQNAWNDFLKRPLIGNGANSFAQKYTTTAHTPGWISNMLLMSLHDTGIIGTLILLTWFGWFAWLTVSAIRAATPSPRRTQLLGLGISIVCLLITYQVTTMLWLGLIWFWFAVVEEGAQLSRT